MSHHITRMDIVTDLRRALSSSYSEKGFSDTNFKTFLKNAEKNLKTINLKKETLSAVSQRLGKAKNPKQSIQKRREDILTAASLL